MRGSLTISAIAHLVVLAMCLVALAAQPLEAPTSTLVVNTISVKDFTELTKGVKDAPQLKVDDIKPLADKVDTPKPADQATSKVVDNKPEIKTDTSAKQEQKPDPKPDPKPADKPAKAKPPDYKPDKIADLLKKDAAKQPKPDAKASPDTPPRDTPKFNADQVAALLDKRDPQRQIATADTLSSQVSPGDSVGGAAQLSETEIAALKARISSCWSPPPGINASTNIKVSFRVLLKQDGFLAQQPVLVEASASPLGPALAESAKRALLTCQPFTMLKPEHYEQWKDLQLDFNPHEILGG
jgi:hypothetical protein